MEIIVVLQNHRSFGYTLTPFYAKLSPEFENRISFGRKAQKSHIGVLDYDFSEAEHKLLKATELISDKVILKKFSRGRKNIIDFQKSIDKKLSKLLLEYFERHNRTIISLVIELKTPLYQRNDKSNVLYDSNRIELPDRASKPVFNFIKNPDESLYFLTIRHENQTIKLSKVKSDVIVITEDKPCNIIIENKLYYFNDINYKKLLPFFTKSFIKIPKSAEEKYFNTFVKQAITNYPYNAIGFEVHETHPYKKASLYVEMHIRNYPILRLEFAYGSFVSSPNKQWLTQVTMEKTEDSYIFFRFDRDLEWEKKHIDLLNSLGLYFDKMESFHIKDRRDDSTIYELICWLNDNYKAIIANGFSVNNSFENKKYFIGKIDITIQPRMKIDWFDVFMVVQFGEFQIPFFKFRKNILNEIREFVLPDGTISILPESWFAEYRDLFLVAQNDDAVLKIPKNNFNIIHEIKSDSHDVSKLYESLVQVNKTEIKQPEKLNATLRPYQAKGYFWLKTLRENNFGGCLADDMGLGKTIQTISLLLFDKQENIKNNTQSENPIYPSLIVCPVSLLHNWTNEITRFAPSLRVGKYVKAERKKMRANFGRYDIILTSYGIIRNDINFLRDEYFSYIVLDESQNIKNPTSKTYAAITRLNSNYKLTLTGTPIENSLVDLWAQLNFLNPGQLGKLSSFKSQFVNWVGKDDNTNRHGKLLTRVQPFILRRVKAQVAKELPTLSEQIVYCQMTEEQAIRYDTEKSKARNAINEMIGKRDNKMLALIAVKSLTKLRQMANHLQLTDKESTIESGKFNVVADRIDSLVAGKHKVLIFSSFVRHLKIYASYFEDMNYKYSMLTGQLTSNKRQEAIDDFQNAEDNYLFLISIKAGGIGLNLTSASYVFILDPWWNPAVEEQAISRAHRIGQDKKVFVYRFISDDTIEQKILELKSSKQALADTFINSPSPVKTLNKESIQELFW